ncbi:MAG: extracellular solute-binding protein [Treponema sp.]|jgi:ABC-type glycerol-3-phosphate transport system substrate-binding protein|nr:extracellular solute-binding protein [Treponema sp.]
MLKKKTWTGFLLFTLIFMMTFPVWAGGGRDVLKGYDIVVGGWSGDYDVNTYKPTSEIEELELEWRKKIQRENGFTMRTKQIAGWGEMLDAIATSIMAGKPAAHAFWVQPDWAMALHRQGLLYPVSDSKAVNLKTSTGIIGRQVAYNQDVAQLFTFAGKQYAIGIGYGGSLHGAGIYFNKRLFREAGLDPDTPYNMQRDGTWNWENFLVLCKQLTRDRNNTGRIDTYAMSADLSTEILDQIVFSNGANYVDKDRNGNFVNASNRPEFIEALQFTIRLRNEGVMMPRPEGSNWDWYWPMFHDGHVAMMMEPEWRRGQLRDMTDDWGFVLFPKGPRARDYRFPNDENVLIIPAVFKPAEVDAILSAINLWHMPVTDDWKSGLYPWFRDRRAVDETMVMIRDPRYSAFRNFIMIPGFNRGEISGQMWWYDGEPAQLIESVSQNWNALIEDANTIER